MICCLAVNDPFVMSAWADKLKTKGKIKMLADPQGKFTKAMKMDLDCTKLLGNVRSKRYALVIEDSVIKSVNTEPDHTGLACLLCIRNFRSAQSAGATWSVLGGAEWFWCKCGRLKEVCDCMVLKRILILGRASYNLVEFTQHTPVTFCWFYLYCCILFLPVQVSL